jgi:26S proteasome regulatory subunit N2
MAYQIGFDLYESATQQFLQRVQSAVRVIAPIPALLPAQKAAGDKAPIQESSATDDKNQSASSGGDKNTDQNQSAA